MSVIPRRFTRYFLLITASPILLSGCLFHDYSSPRVDGTLANAGEPLAGVTVSLTEFDKEVATTSTDSSGHFSLKPKGSWQLFIPVGPQDRLSHWAVAIERPDGKLILYNGSRFGGVFSGYSGSDRLTLSCDIANANVDPQLSGAMKGCIPHTSGW